MYTHVYIYIYIHTYIRIFTKQFYCQLRDGVRTNGVIDQWQFLFICSVFVSFGVFLELVHMLHRAAVESPRAAVFHDQKKTSSAAIFHDRCSWQMHGMWRNVCILKCQAECMVVVAKCMYLRKPGKMYGIRGKRHVFNTSW